MTDEEMRMWKHLEEGIIKLTDTNNKREKALRACFEYLRTPQNGKLINRELLDIVQQALWVD